MALIRFLFFLLLFYFLFKILGRYVFPLLVKRYVNSKKKQYYQQNPNARPEQGKEGDIHIRKPSDRKRRVNADAAEYVDYEEVEDLPDPKE